MTEDPPPTFCVNSWAAGADTLTLLSLGVRCLARRYRRWREIRMLERIGVLQPTMLD